LAVKTEGLKVMLKSCMLAVTLALALSPSVAFAGDNSSQGQASNGDNANPNGAPSQYDGSVTSTKDVGYPDGHWANGDGPVNPNN